jgi:hypothetical protein
MGSEITPDKARRLKHFQLISFLDADIAGVTSTIKLRKAVGRIIHRVDYPDHLQGEDPGSLSPQNIDLCLKRLVPMI